MPLRELDQSEVVFSSAEKHKKLTEDELEVLVKAAHEASTRAYCKYSKFAVGAAILTEDGSIVKGCNVENVSYGLTNCAERTAIYSAVTMGHRKFKAVVIVSDKVASDRVVGPCGACRQVLAEFGTDIEVYLAKSSGEYIKTTLSKLLPDGFTPEWVQLGN